MLTRINMMIIVINDRQRHPSTVSRYRNFAGFLVLSAVWGSSFVAAKVGLTDLGPVLLAAFRFDLVALLMVAYAAVATDRWRPRGRAEWREVAVSGVTFVAIHHALLFAGQQYVTAGVAAVVVSSIPVLVAGLSRALLPSERLSLQGALGLLFGLLGVVAVARPDPSNLLATNVVGIALVFGSAAGWAIGAVLLERDRTTLPAPTMQAWMMVVGAPLLHLAAPFAGEPLSSVRFTREVALSLLYLAPVAGGLGYLLYFDLQDRLGPMEINLVNYATPAFAAVTGLAVLSEPIAPATVGGFLLILVGFALVKFEAVREEVERLCSSSEDLS